jgi:hypothetical protein
MEVDYTLFSLDRDILLIDETRNGSGSSMLDPTDAAVDSFYHQLLSGYNYDDLDVIAEDRAPDVFDISHYKLLIWHYDVIEQTRIQQSVPALKAYLEAGGTIIFSGMKLLNNLGSDFTAPYLGIQSSLENAQADFVRALGESGFPDLPLDSSKITIGSFNNRLRFISVYDTTAPARSLYRFMSHTSNPQYHLNPCGIKAVSVFDTTRTGAISLAFPLYFTNVDSAQLFIDRAISELGTITSLDLPEKPIAQEFQLFQNYPNPFNPVTVFSWFIPNPAQGGDGQLAVGSNVTLEIYNLRGQKVKTLLSASLHSGFHSVEFKATNLASGIYFYRLQAGRHVETKKMVVLK